MSNTHRLQDASGIIELVDGAGIMKVESDSAPSNSAVGYAPGCSWHRYSAYSANAQRYVNAGTALSATWVVESLPDSSGNKAYTGTETHAGTATFTGAITPTGGVAASGGFVADPKLVHTGGIPAYVSTYGTNSATNTGGTVYFSEIFVPANMSVTGISIFNGTAVAGNGKLILYNSSGVKIAITASTAMSGTTAYQRIALTGGPIAVLGPATYYIGATYDTTTHDLRGHVLGDFATGTLASTTYGTDSTLTPIVVAGTFAADIGPVASLY